MVLASESGSGCSYRSAKPCFTATVDFTTNMHGVYLAIVHRNIVVDVYFHGMRTTADTTQMATCSQLRWNEERRLF